MKAALIIMDHRLVNHSICKSTSVGGAGGGEEEGREGGRRRKKKTSFQLHRPNCIHVQTLRWEADGMGAVLIASTQSPAFTEGTQCHCYRVNRRFSKTGTVIRGVGRGGGGLKHTKISITETPEKCKGDFILVQFVQPCSVLDIVPGLCIVGDLAQEDGRGWEQNGQLVLGVL